MPAHRFHGLELPVRREVGARAIRVVHPPGQKIDCHRHDWPLLTIPMLGGYREETEDGAIAIDGPAVIFHPAGCCHANCIHGGGMETFTVEFDPAWIGTVGHHLDRSCVRVGGKAALGARKLVHAWRDLTTSAERLRQATAEVVANLFAADDIRLSSWVTLARSQVDGKPTAAIARDLRIHPAWLAREYRRAIGEGLRETSRRFKIERAVLLLRESDLPIAEIAAATGFCDQSHLNRSFAILLGRTPLEVRRERDRLPRSLPN